MEFGGRLATGNIIAKATPASFEVLATWVETLHGHGDFRGALGSLCELIGGNLAIVSRASTCGTQAKTVSVVDREAGKLFSNRLPRAYAAEIMADTGLPARHGSVWLMSELMRDADLELSRDIADDMAERGVRDIAIIPIDAHRESVDYLELQFHIQCPEHSQVLLIVLASALSKSWKSRLPGTAEKLMAGNRVRRATPAEPAEAVDILDVTNPAGLSRSEYRICALIREGMLAKEIAGKLGIRTSTMRSHLRSIYAKTGASSQVELLHQLTMAGDLAFRSARISA